MSLKRIPTILVLCCLLILSAHAKEGSDSYPHGAENWMLGNVPGPGIYHLNYLVYYSGELRDGEGNKANLAGSTPSVSALADASRFLWVANSKFLGGNFAAHIIVPVVYQSVDMGGTKSITSLGDLSLLPFGLTYHGKVAHQYVALEVDAPTGHFNSSDPRVSVGAGAWTVMPIYGVSLMPRSGWDISGKFMYDVHLKNGSDNYKSGQEFHSDYLIGKHWGQWGLAGAGYLVKQVTDDTVNGVTVQAANGLYSTGRRGQVFSIGPSALYTTKSHLMFIAQYMHETEVRNRFGGDKMLFRVIIPASALMKKK